MDVLFALNAMQEEYVPSTEDPLESFDTLRDALEHSIADVTGPVEYSPNEDVIHETTEEVMQITLSALQKAGIAAVVSKIEDFDVSGLAIDVDSVNPHTFATTEIKVAVAGLLRQMMEAVRARLDYPFPNNFHTLLPQAYHAASAYMCLLAEKEIPGTFNEPMIDSTRSIVYEAWKSDLPAQLRSLADLFAQVAG